MYEKHCVLREEIMIYNSKCFMVMLTRNIKDNTEIIILITGAYFQIVLKPVLLD